MSINCNEDMTPIDITELVWLLNLENNNTLNKEQKKVLEGLLEFSEIVGIHELRKEAKLLKDSHEQLEKLVWKLIFQRKDICLSS